MTNVSNYSGSHFVIATLHKKGQAIAPIFFKKLGVTVVECAVDTDSLGSFSGEIHRKHGFLETARMKCELGLRQANDKYGLASEGSFGPHPYIPFLMVNVEILYFIDTVRDFHLYLTHTSEKHNYATSVVRSFSELQNFAIKSLFPDHALIVRPNISDNKTIIFKGIQSESGLQEAFDISLSHSVDGAVWVETDMRAHMNPSRMLVIQELAEKMAQRLAAHCPSCLTPGWGFYCKGKKIECSWCHESTLLDKTEIFGCVTCSYQEEKDSKNHFVGDLREYCTNCNP